MNTSSLRRPLLAVVSVLLLGFSGLAAAEPPSRAARLGDLDGTVSFSPAGQPEWVRAVVNRPLTTGDRLWTGSRSRAELQIGGAAIRMGIGITQVIGNVFPDYRFSFSNDFQWKKLTVYATLDATMGHEINNQGEGWGLLDLSSAQFDHANKTVETAKPVGYSWRAGGPEAAGSGGFYDVLGPNNYNTEDRSYANFRELALTYRVGRVGGVGDWTIGAVGRNLFTITGYTGLDPETGVAGGSTGSSIINQVEAFGFPNLRTFTFSLSTRF